jgi:hypothetical protein
VTSTGTATDPITDPRARGAFLVAARRADGSVGEVEPHSERGGTVRIADPWGAGAARLTDARGARVPHSLNDGLLTWTTRPGATYTLKPARPRHLQES